MTIIILTIVAIDLNNSDKWWDWRISLWLRLSGPGGLPREGTLVRRELLWHLSAEQLSLVLSKLSSAALAGSALSTLSSPLSSSLDVGKAVFAPANSHLADRSARWADMIYDQQSTSWLSSLSSLSSYSHGTPALPFWKLHLIMWILDNRARAYRVEGRPIIWIEMQWSKSKTEFFSRVVLIILITWPGGACPGRCWPEKFNFWIWQPDLHSDLDLADR